MHQKTPELNVGVIYPPLVTIIKGLWLVIVLSMVGSNTFYQIFLMHMINLAWTTIFG